MSYMSIWVPNIWSWLGRVFSKLNYLDLFHKCKAYILSLMEIPNNSVARIQWFCVSTFFMFGFSYILNLESFELCLLEAFNSTYWWFLKQITSLSQMSAFFRNCNHPWICTQENQDFQKILAIKFWNFTTS